MSALREQLRKVLAGPACTPIAPIFDPLSARIAQLVGWKVLKLTGGTAKAATLAVPDEAPLADMSDTADMCRRITRLVDLPIIVDGDDGGGNAITIFRTVKELEAAGASAIELEDSIAPKTMTRRVAHEFDLISTEEHAGKLRAAVAARRDPTTAIVARTRAIAQDPLPDALERLRAYVEAGADAIYLAGNLRDPRSDIAAVHGATGLPIYLLRLPADLAKDAPFLAANRVTLQTFDMSVYTAVVKVLHESLTTLLQERDTAVLKPRRASDELLRAVVRTEEFIEWEAAYLPADITG